MRVDNLFSVANHRNVRTMRHHNYLASLLNILDHRYKQPVDRLAVEVLFGLVNDDRFVALVDEQIEDEQQGSAFAG